VHNYCDLFYKVDSYYSFAPSPQYMLCDCVVKSQMAFFPMRRDLYFSNNSLMLFLYPVNMLLCQLCLIQLHVWIVMEPLNSTPS